MKTRAGTPQRPPRNVHKPPTMSLVVCTYNRCESLRDVLAALARQQLRGVFAEILVVDNNGTDETKLVTERARMTSYWPVRYLFEPRQGKSYACNLAIRQARGQWIAFTDDDTIPESGWAQSLYEAFVSQQADCVGGQILPLWLANPPAWLLRPAMQEELWGKLALLDRGRMLKIAEPAQQGFLYGANVAFRKDVLLETGLFRTDIGPRGREQLKCEDTELVGRLVALGKRVVYAPEAIVYHKVPPHRMRLSYFRRWQFNWSRTMTRLAASPIPAVPQWYVREWLSNGLRVLRAYGRGDLDRAVKLDLVFWHQCGRIVETLRQRWTIQESANGRKAISSGRCASAPS